eukprot:UN1160
MRHRRCRNSDNSRACSNAPLNGTRIALRRPASWLSACRQCCPFRVFQVMLPCDGEQPGPDRMRRPGLVFFTIFELDGDPKPWNNRSLGGGYSNHRSLAAALCPQLCTAAGQLKLRIPWHSWCHYPRRWPRR